MTHATSSLNFPPERIKEMVDTFYGRVREDDLIGPVFDARIDDWPHHLGRMTFFWRAVLRGDPVFSPGPRGGPPMLHRAIQELSHAHFRRWLALFAEVVDDLWPTDEAEHIKRASQRIGMALSAHIPREPEAAPATH